MKPPHIFRCQLAAILVVVAGCATEQPSNAKRALPSETGDFGDATVTSTLNDVTGDIETEVWTHGSMALTASFNASTETVTYTRTSDGESSTFEGIAIPSGAGGLGGANWAAYMAFKHSGSGYDAPGCNVFPDTPCSTACCADHDQCYDEHDCGASSWIPWVGSDACNACNQAVVQCMWNNYGCTTPDENGKRPCDDFPCGCDQHECYEWTCPWCDNRQCCDSCSDIGTEDEAASCNPL